MVNKFKKLQEKNVKKLTSCKSEFSHQEEEPQWSFQRWFKGERGTSVLAMFILLVPMFVITFAFGFDALRYVYVKDKMQDILDAAAQTAAAQTVSQVDSSGKPYISLDTDGFSGRGAGYTYGYSEKVANDFYNSNTSDWRGRIFSGTTAPPLKFSIVSENSRIVSDERSGGTGLGLYAADLCLPFNETGTPKYGVELVSKEKVPTTFFSIFTPIDDFDLQLESKAYLRGIGC